MNQVVVGLAYGRERRASSSTGILKGAGVTRQQFLTTLPERKIQHLLCHQGRLGTVSLQQDSDHVCLWPETYTTKPTSTATLVEWRSVVFSDESRFCLSASDGLTHVRRGPGERHLPECTRQRHTGPTSGFIVWEAISYNSLSDLVFLQGKVNSARYIAYFF